MRLQGASHMFLDISHRSADWIRGRFPSIYQHCLREGLDMTAQPLPVVPAAHYFCGGVETDLKGRTTVPGLFAAGMVGHDIYLVFPNPSLACFFGFWFPCSCPCYTKPLFLLFWGGGVYALVCL